MYARMDNAPKNFFRRRRDELGLTQREIAIAMDVTENAIGNWERGENLPQMRFLSKLAEVYQVSPSRVAREIAEMADAAN